MTMPDPSSSPAWPAGAMFDLDGTLIDREPLMMEAIGHVFTAEGVALTPEESSYSVGRAWQDVYTGLAVADRLGWEFGQFLDRVFADAEQMIRDGAVPRILPGGRELVVELKAHGVPVALVTGSRHSEVRPALRQLDLVGVFDQVVAADDYERGKPAPDAYLLGAERLAVAVAGCVAFEDSAAGVASALAAGCRVVASEAANLPEGHPARQDLSAASWVVPSLADVRVATLVDRFA